MASIVTSNQELDLREATVNVRVINMPNGQKGKFIPNLSDAIANKHSITQIKNNDIYCLPRAIVAGLTYLIENSHRELPFRGTSHCELPLCGNQDVKNIFSRLGHTDFSDSKLKYIRDSRSGLQK